MYETKRKLHLVTIQPTFDFLDLTPLLLREAGLGFLIACGHRRVLFGNGLWPCRPRPAHKRRTWHRAHVSSGAAPPRPRTAYRNSPTGHGTGCFGIGSDCGIEIVIVFNSGRRYRRCALDRSGRVAARLGHLFRDDIFGREPALGTAGMLDNLVVPPLHELFMFQWSRFLNGHLSDGFLDRHFEGLLNRLSSSGFLDGHPDGLLDGRPDGLLDGCSDGLLDGLLDGRPNWLLDRRPDGLLDGRPDGLLDGRSDGLLDGHPDGLLDGCSDVLLNGDLSHGLLDRHSDGLVNGCSLDGLFGGHFDELVAELVGGWNRWGKVGLDHGIGVVEECLTGVVVDGGSIH